MLSLLLYSLQYERFGGGKRPQIEEKLHTFCFNKTAVLQHIDWKALTNLQGRDIEDGMIITRVVDPDGLDRAASLSTVRLHLYTS